MKNFLIPMMFFGVLFMPLSVISQESDGIEEVIVTAEKKESNLQDVPTVIDVLTASQIEDMNVINVSDISKALPSVNLNYNIDPFNAAIRIRGIGTSQSDISLESDVALVVDGVYLNKTGLGLNDLVDLERIEILQGPQGTLYGKNSNAGVINITTKTPQPGDSDGYISYESGDFGSTKTTAAMSFGLTESIAMRLTAHNYQTDGYMTNILDGGSLNGSDDSVLSLKIYAENDKSKFVFTHTDSSKDSSCCAADSVPLSGNMNIARQLGFGPINGPDLFDYVVGINEGAPVFELDSILSSLKIDRELENGTLTYVVARSDYDTFRSRDTDHTAVNFAMAAYKNEGDSLTNELRFVSNMIGNKEYTIGLFFSDSTYSEVGAYDNNRWLDMGAEGMAIFSVLAQNAQSQLPTLQQAIAGATAAGNSALIAQLNTQLRGLMFPLMFANTVSPGDGIIQDMTYHDKTSAVFGRVTVHVTDTLRYTLGARYTSEKKEADLYAQPSLVGVVSPQLANFLGNPAIVGLPRQAILGNDGWILNSFMNLVDKTYSREDDSSTWSASIQKDLSDNVMLYASAATGFKAGGFNSVSGETADERSYDKTESTNFEIGIKSRLLNNKLQFNATVFDMETDDQQFITMNATGTGRTIGNATEPAERFGLDLNMIAKLRPNLTLNFAYVTIDDGSPDILSNAANRLTADDAYSVGLSHFFPLRDGKVFSRIDYSYDGKSEFTGQVTGSPQWQSRVPDGYEFLGSAIDNEFLNIKLGWRNDNWELAYSIKNATDNKTILLALAPQGLTSNVHGVTFGPPEMHSFSIKYDF